MATNRSVHELSDDELEDCIDGSSNLDMIRDILTKHKVVNDQGYVDAENFADWFAIGVEGYIDAEVTAKNGTKLIKIIGIGATILLTQ